MAERKGGGDPPLTVARLPKSYESLSLLLELLAEDDFFGQEPLGRMMKVVKSQVSAGTHFVVFRDKHLIAYGGWIYCLPANGEAWMKGGGTLQPLEPKRVAALPVEQRAAALTVVATREAAALPPLMRRMRDAHRGYRIFFKRDYLARGAGERKGTVRAI